jgi:hypothetical protein
MITDKMDARSEITHVAELVVRIATWLRGKAQTLPGRIIFCHNYSIIPCDALDGADPKRCLAGAVASPMACGWAKEPGTDERFGA